MKTDQGWAWIVLAASMGSNFLNGSLVYFVGVVHAGLLRKYNQSVTMTAWAGGIYSSLMCLGAPLASFIIGRYGCRICCVAGGILCFTGLTASAFVTSVGQLFLTYGLIAGMGLCFAYTPTIVTIGYYFDKFRGLASGVSVAASAIGILAGNLIMQSLMNEYSLGGAFLLAGAISLHYALFGMFYRPTVYEKCSISVDEDVVEESHKSSLGSVQSLTLHGIEVRLTKSVQCVQAEGKGRKGPECCVPLLQEVTLKKDESHVSDLDDYKHVSLPAEQSSKIVGRTEDNRTWGCDSDAENDVRRLSEPEAVDSCSPLNGCAVLSSENGSAQLNRTENLGYSNKEDDCTDNKKCCYSHAKNNSKDSYTQLKAEHSADNALTWTDEQRHSSQTGLSGDCFQRTLISSEQESSAQAHAKDTTTAHTDHICTDHLQLPINSCDFTTGSVSVVLDTPKGRSKSEPIINVPKTASATDAADRQMELAGSGWRAYRTVLSNRAFLFYCLSVLCSNFTLSGVYLHLPEYAQTQGTTPSQSATLFVAVGIMSLVSRLAAGFSTTDERIDANVINMGLYGLCGLATALFPFYSDTYQGQMAFSALFGLYTGGASALYSSLTVRFVGVALLNTGFGVLGLIMGIGYIAGPPLAALIVDYGGTYEHSFILLGIMMELAFFLNLTAAFFLNIQRDSTCIVAVAVEDRDLTQKPVVIAVSQTAVNLI